MIIHCTTSNQIKRIAHLYKLNLLDSVFILNSLWGGMCIDTIRNEYHSKEYYKDYDMILYEDWTGDMIDYPHQQ